MKLVLPGGAGSLGRRIAAHRMAMGDEVVVLTRSELAGVELAAGRPVQWDGRRVGDWAGELAGAVVVNLAGALVDRRPTAVNVELLTRSRVEPTRALVQAAQLVTPAPPVWVQASTLAIYGDAGDETLDESARPADGPPQMAGVARAWEAAVAGANAGRVVVLRTGIVLDRHTPALDRLTKVVRWGLGGRIAGGRQWISWIHVGDFLGVFDRIVGGGGLDGVVHVTSPNPVRNVELMAALRRVLHRPRFTPPTPAFMVRLGSVVLRTDPALALTGRRCVPARLQERGFQFKHPDIEPALRDLLTKPGGAGPSR